MFSGSGMGSKYHERSYLGSWIKEDILGGDDKSLEEQAIEAKESAKRAKSKLRGLQGGDQGLFQLQGEQPRLHQGGVPEVSRQGQDMPKMWDQGSL